MKVEFLSRFGKDLDAVNDKQVKQLIKEVILEVESAPTLREITNLKKLSGHRTAFRIRIGDYRMGVFVEKGTVQFARLAHRKDIYKVFP